MGYKDYINRQAEQDFNKARNRAILTDIQSFMNPDKERLRCVLLSVLLPLTEN